MTITVSVKLFASLAKYKPIGTQAPVCEVELDEKTTVARLALELGIPKAEIKTISLNDQIVKIDTPLNNGDSLILFPTIAGG